LRNRPRKFLGDRKGLLANRNQNSFFVEIDKNLSSGSFIYPDAIVQRRGHSLKNSTEASALAQFDELLILSCDCKQTNRVTAFVTELCGAAIHYCVFTIYTPNKTVIIAACTVGKSLELRDPGFWHLQFLQLSPDSSTALYNYHILRNIRNPERISNIPEQHSCRQITAKQNPFKITSTTFSFAQKSVKAKVKNKRLVRTHRQKFTVHLFLGPH
jgi:hypothetical protein